jgi:hypothetical protein
MYIVLDCLLQYIIYNQQNGMESVKYFVLV